MEMRVDVARGSLADMTTSVCDVRFTPESGHQSDIVECPARAISEEQAVVVREPNAAVHLTLQNDQLMSKRRILFDLNGAAKVASTKHNSAIMVR